ncbi:hypothetical protein WG66_016278 [Moniliophthora roreri]|nr:hypothetical protein WG66_016278 [Moniliophthora roreri]
MAQLEDTPYLINFIRDTRLRIETSKEAIQILRGLGSPTSPTNMSIPSVESAVMAIAGLGDFLIPVREPFPQKIAQIKENWDGIVGPWTTFLTEKVALAGGIRLKDDDELANKAVLALCLMLGYPSQCGENARSEGKQLRATLGPHALNLLVQMWLKVLASSHYTWRILSMTLQETLFYMPHDRPSQDLTDEFIRIHNAGLYDISRISIGFFRYAIPHIPAMNGQDLGALRSIFVLFYSGFFPHVHVIYEPFLANGGIKILIRVFDALVSKPISNDKKYRYHLEAAAACLRAVLGATIRPSALSEALHAGLFQSMVKASRFCREDQLDSDNSLQSLWHSFTKMQQLTSVYLIYPDVLRRFSISIEKMRRSDDPGDGPDTFESLGDMIKDKVVYLKVIYNNFKTQNSLCNYKECPNRLSPSGRTPERRRYLRCTACLTVMFCSEECGRKHWKYHRESCRKLAQALRGEFLSQMSSTWAKRFTFQADGRPHPAENDIRFFKMILDAYIQRHRQEICRKVDGFVSQGWPSGNSNSDLSTRLASRLKQANRKGLVLVINFLEVEDTLQPLCSPTRIRVRPLHLEMNENRFKDHQHRLPSIFADGTIVVDDSRVLLFAYFADPEGLKSWPYIEILDLPRGR